MASPSNKGKNIAEGSTSEQPLPQQPQPPPNSPALSRYESQKRRDWNTFGQYLRNQQPPVHISQCSSNNILDFLQYLDQFGKTKVHAHGCIFFGQVEPAGQCNCPLKQAWGSLDALIGRLRAAYEENTEGCRRETHLPAVGLGPRQEEFRTIKGRRRGGILCRGMMLKMVLRGLVAPTCH
ncbi:unnamed protein product, partial [Brassica oleracea]